MNIRCVQCYACGTVLGAGGCVHSLAHLIVHTMGQVRVEVWGQMVPPGAFSLGGVTRPSVNYTNPQFQME